MIRTLFFLLLLCDAFQVHSQAGSEWWQQNQSEIGYQYAQIAALETSNEEDRTGNELVRSGLNLIGSTQLEDYMVHSNYLTSLGQINPQLQTKGWTSRIPILLSEILQSCFAYKRDIMANGFLDGKETNFAESVLNFLIEDCGQIAQKFLRLLTVRYWKMSDGDRMRYLNSLYGASLDRYIFVQQFGIGLKILGTGRQRDYWESIFLKSLNEGEQ